MQWAFFQIYKQILSFVEAHCIMVSFFTSFMSNEIFCICFFAFIIGKLIRYQYFFNIYVVYIDYFLRKLSLPKFSNFSVIFFISLPAISIVTYSRNNYFLTKTRIAGNRLTWDGQWKKLEIFL